jgi:CubicO group peptidase (beta-lactamase class C family)
MSRAVVPESPIATLPLIDQPGAGFHYGISTDLLGFLVARLDGESLGEVLARRIFGPLGMRDTGFVVSRDKRERRAAPRCAASIVKVV